MRPDNAIDCDVCEASGRYPIYAASGKLRMWIECPGCCGAGHDFGEAAEVAADKVREQEELLLRKKYEDAVNEMRRNRDAG